PLGQGGVGRADHFPPLGKPFRNILPAQGSNSAGHVVSKTGPQDYLEGCLHFWRIALDAQILVEISPAPTKIAPTPGTAAMASAFFKPSAVSIIMIANKSPSGFNGHTSARRSYSAAETPHHHTATPGA